THGTGLTAYLRALHAHAHPRDPHSFPPRRSSDLAARAATTDLPIVANDLESDPVASGYVASLAHPGGNLTDVPGLQHNRWRRDRDRKSTRLNSSHLVISYAVFCLRKKIKDQYHMI